MIQDYLERLREIKRDLFRCLHSKLRRNARKLRQYFSNDLAVVSKIENYIYFLNQIEALNFVKQEK